MLDTMQNAMGEADCLIELQLLEEEELRETNAAKRKEIPIGTGFIDYFPDAVAEVANLSWVGSQQHNPGKLMHWDKSKSTDEANALMRHFIDRGTRDIDGVRHSTKVAWRAMALLQREIESEAKNDDVLAIPLQPGDKFKCYFCGDGQEFTLSHIDTLQGRDCAVDTHGTAHGLENCRKA